MKKLLALITLATGLTTAGSALADAPPYARIRSLSYGGTGCPAGTLAENLSPDLQAITLLFDQYIAEIGPGIPRHASRQNCQINLDIDHPQGWQYSVSSVDTRGYVAIDRGVTATQSSTYYFAGQTNRAVLRSVMQGPLDKDYQIRDALALSALVWSPCGAARALNIATQVYLTTRDPRATGLITTDRIDLGSRHSYFLQWRRCR